MSTKQETKNKDKTTKAEPKDKPEATNKDKKGETAKNTEGKAQDNNAKDGKNRDEKPKDNKRDGEKRPRTEGGEKRQRRERPKRDYDPDWRKKLNVTLDTPIDPEPKEILKKPDSEQLQKNLKECDRKIDEYKKDIEKNKTKRREFFDKLKAQREEERKARIESKDNALLEREANKHLFDDHKSVTKDANNLSDQKKKIEAEMAAISKEVDAARKIEQLEETQMTSQMTGNEEKRLFSELSQLKKIIKNPEDLPKMKKREEELRAQRKEITDKLRPLLEAKRNLRTKIDALKKKQEEEQKNNPRKEDGGNEAKTDEKGERKRTEDPFSPKIDDLREKISQMYKRKDTLRDQYEKAWDNYHDQQDLLRKREYIVKQKDYLRRIEEIKEKKAKELRAQLLEEYLINNTPKEDASLLYKDEIASCELLESYLASLLPSNRKLLKINRTEEKVITEEEVLEKIQGDSKLASMGLKPIIKKEEPLYNDIKKKGKGKKNKKAEAPKKEEPKVEETEEDLDDPNRKLIFELQIRNAFTQLNIEPPTINKELEDSINEIEKKRIEYESQVAEKEKEIASLRENAEKEVPSIDELKIKFADAPAPRTRDRDRKDRRGDRGNVQWRGKNDERHPHKTGDAEKIEEAETFGDIPAEEVAPEPEKKREQRDKKLTAEDFPSL